MTGGSSRIREVENYKSQVCVCVCRGGLVNVIRPSGFINRHLLKLGSYLPQRLGDRSPICRYWLEQTVNSFDSLEISQAELRGVG